MKGKSIRQNNQLNDVKPKILFLLSLSPFVSAGLAEASRKNIQKTEKWRAEKCLPAFAGLFAPSEHCFDDIKLYFSVIAFCSNA